MFENDFHVFLFDNFHFQKSQPNGRRNQNAGAVYKIGAAFHICVFGIGEDLRWQKSWAAPASSGAG
jgi:hypothetical protein